MDCLSCFREQSLTSKRVGALWGISLNKNLISLGETLIAARAGPICISPNAGDRRKFFAFGQRTGAAGEALAYYTQ